jgi:hypothetical protein
MNSRHLPALLIAGTAVAQGDPDAITTRGPLALMPFAVSMPHALVAGTPSNPVAPDEFGFKLPGDQTTPPFALPIAPLYAAVPDYRMATMFPGLLAAGRLHEVDIDAFSTGNDRIQYDQSGVVDAAALDGWTRLVFGVRSTAQGTGGPLQARVQANLSVGSDVYSYLFPGSVGMPAPLLGEVLLEIPGEAMALGSTQDMQAGDCAMPRILLDNGLPSTMVTVTHRLFFSLTNHSATALNQGSDPFPGLPELDGGTIYELRWDATEGEWEEPIVAIASSAIDLAPGEDVDALAVHAAANVSHPLKAVLLSTVASTSAPGVEQIQAIVGLGSSMSLLPLSDGGEPIRLGIKLHIADDIDVLASMDPEQNIFDYHLGTPFPIEAPLPAMGPGVHDNLGLSIVTTPWDPALQGPAVRILVSGWCSGPSEAGTLVLFQGDNFGWPGYTPIWGDPIAFHSHDRTSHEDWVEFVFPLPGPAQSLMLGDIGFYAAWMGQSTASCISYGSAMAW